MIVGHQKDIRIDEERDEDGDLAIEVKDRHGWISKDDAIAVIDHLNKIFRLGYDDSKQN